MANRKYRQLLSYIALSAPATRRTGVDIRHFTISNCLVNMVSPNHYRDFLLPFDKQIAETYGLIGIHNCAWNADPYITFGAS